MLYFLWHKNLRILLVQAACCMAFFLPAQEPVMRHFSLKDGLPSLELYQVYQDHAGFIWVCTDAGIARYNANYFKLFNSSNGLPDNAIFEVKEDKKNRMWYRSYTGKIGYIFHDTVFRLPDNPLIAEFQEEGIINSFAVDDSDNVILGKQNTKEISFLKISPPYFTKNTKAVWKNTDKKFGADIHMINATDFVYSVKLANKSLGKYYISIYNLPTGTIQDSVELSRWAPFNRILPLVNNRLEFVVGRDLLEYNLSERTVSKKQLTEDLITAYRDERLFFTSGYHTGLQRLEGKGKEPAPWLNKNTITSIIKDRQSGYWLATLNSGLFYIPNTAFKVFNRTSGKEANVIHHLSQLNEKQYIIGFTDGSIRVMSVEGDRLTDIRDFDLRTMKAMSTDVIRGYCRFSEYEIILCFNDNCWLINPEKKTSRPMKQKGKHLYMSFKKIVRMKDKICMATYKELCFIDTTDFLIKDEHVVSSDDRLTSLAYDAETGQLYVGGLHGLYRYKGGKKISRENRVLDCSVEGLACEAGYLYVGTKEKGLVVIGPKGADTITEKKGLTGDVCKLLVVHHNELWALTNGGISWINYKGSGSYTIKNYPLSAFLFDGTINNLCVTDSFLYFSSNDNVYVFPYREDKAGGPFYIKSFSAGGKLMDPLRHTELNYDVKNITITYEALFYTNTRHIEYRYRMGAADTTWNYTSETSVTFPSLAPGAYSVILEAKAGNGRWVRCKSDIVFRVGLPFWLTWWFIAMEIILLAGCIIVWIAFRYSRTLKKEREKNEMQNKIYELEAQASKAQMNPHFIFNSLNSIQQFILGNDNDKAFSYLTRFSKLIRRLLESNRTGSLTLEAEVDILEKYLEIESFRFKGSFRYTVEVEKGIMAARTKIPHMMVQPFVENAIWHGLLHKKDDRQLIVRFSYLDSETLVCTVDDNGVGRGHVQEKEGGEDKKSLGLSLIRERLHLFSKVKNAAYGIHFTDKENGQGGSNGTTVEIRLPVID